MPNQRAKNKEAVTVWIDKKKHAELRRRLKEKNLQLPELLVLIADGHVSF